LVSQLSQIAYHDFRNIPEFRSNQRLINMCGGFGIVGGHCVLALPLGYGCFDVWNKPATIRPRVMTRTKSMITLAQRMPEAIRRFSGRAAAVHEGHTNSL
jgi:hypothetical protein